MEGDAGQLRQVLVNLLENAVHAASPEPARSGCAARRRRDGAGRRRRGHRPGVGQAARGRLFEPLITTKERGIGLGLALVKRIAERHGGAVLHEPRAGGGTRFTLRLPAP